jgi:hypothetical protein
VPAPFLTAAARRPWVPGVLALLLLAAGAPAASAGLDGSRDLPLLWQGQVADTGGHPTAATVIAAVRPPAAAIPSQADVERALADGREPLGLPSIPLAEAPTDRLGRFELRAALPALPAGYAPDGWINVIVFAVGDGGQWSIATDSVRFVAARSGASGGQWITHAEPSPAPRSAAEDLADADERPPVMTLNAPLPAPSQRTLAARWKGPGDPYRGCNARYVEERQDGFRTISDIDVGPQWAYRIDYQSTGTTSWDVGYERSAGQWGVAGTASFSQDASSGFNAEFGPYPGRFRESYQVQLTHARVLWQCGSTSSPGPFYVRTVEAERWTGGTYNQGDPVVGCNRHFTAPVAGNTFSWRQNGKSSKWSASGNLWGFSGQATVAYTKTIRLGWVNKLPQPRYVCGESGDPYAGKTRVTALD